MYAPHHSSKLTKIGRRLAQNDNYIGVFVLHFTPDRHYIFHRLSQSVAMLYQRALRDHDFIALWQKSDHDVLMATLDVVRAEHKPIHLRAHSHPLIGKAMPCQFSFHPLRHSRWGHRYIFGKIDRMHTNTGKIITGHSLKK